MTATVYGAPEGFDARLLRSTLKLAAAGIALAAALWLAKAPVLRACSSLGRTLFISQNQK